MKTMQGYSFLTASDLKPGMILKFRSLSEIEKLDDMGLIRCGWDEDMNRYVDRTITLTESLIRDLKYNDDKFERGIITDSFVFSLSMFVIDEEKPAPKLAPKVPRRPEKPVADMDYDEEDLEVEKSKTEEKIEKDGNNMFNKLFSTEKLNAGEVTLTTDGRVAVRRADGDYVCYDKETNVIQNQMDFVLEDLDEAVVIVPTNTIKADDVIKKDGSFFYIKEVKGNKITAVNLNTSTTEVLTKETSLLGAKFYSKVTSLMDIQNSGIDPMMLMFMMKDGEDSSMKDMLMIQMMQGQTTGEGKPAIDPMMLMLMMKDGEGGSMKDMLIMQMMMQSQGQDTSAINPMLLMMGKKDISMKDMLMIQMMQNQTKVAK